MTNTNGPQVAEINNSLNCLSSLDTKQNLVANGDTIRKVRTTNDKRT